MQYARRLLIDRHGPPSWSNGHTTHPGAGSAGRHHRRPFEMPTIDVALLWHRRRERDTAQRWLRDTLARATAEVGKDLLGARRV